MDVIQALTPTVVVAVAFFAIIRAIFRADRNERASIARMEKNSAENE
ncbi:MAG TPA: hypothetical protein GX743_09475 [Actinomycetales bacterium]|nr:hypothetical protein [Actinomycetales bacterium]